MDNSNNDTNSILSFLCKDHTVSSLTPTIDLIGKDTGASIVIEDPAGPAYDMRLLSIPHCSRNAVARLIDAVVEAEGAGRDGEPVFCRVMIAKVLVGLFMGRKGKNVDRIRNETGARIRVLPLHVFVHGSDSVHEVVQISGEPLAVKKAVIAVAAFLQDNSPSRREHIDRRDSGSAYHVSLPDVRSEKYSDTATLSAAGSSVDFHAVPCPNLCNGHHMQEKRKDRYEVSYRLLCSNHTVGGVIGKGAAIVKALEKETGASIRCGGIIAQSDERVITITGFESPGTRFSPMQNAVIRVSTRIIESSFEKRVGPEKVGSEKAEPIVARLLVPSDQIGCLMGKGGSILSEIRKVSGTNIMIISGCRVPKCASKDDEVVQVSGRLTNVQDGLFHITSRLRNNIFASKMPDNEPSSFQSRDTSNIFLSKGLEATPKGLSEFRPSDGSHLTTLTQSLEHLRLQSNSHPSQVRGPQISENMYSMPMSGFDGVATSSRHGPEFGRGNKYIMVRNTTMEIVVPSHCIPLVYGNNGANLGSIRQISGAQVIVNDPLPGANEGIVIISGTPDQSLAAQSLLQSYISTRQP